MMKKILTWGALSFILFYIALSPDSAGDVFKSLGTAIADIAQGLGEFFTTLVS